jgi:hypothetical protein
MNLVESNAAAQKAFDSHLVGGVEHCTAAIVGLQALPSQPQAGKPRCVPVILK